MKLLLLDQFSELGGGQQCLLDLLPAIRARGWDALVAVPGDGPVVSRVRDAGFNSVPLDCGPYSYGRKTVADMVRFVTQMPRLRRQIQTLADRFHADLLYVNGPRLLPAVSDTDRPVVHHAHRILPARAVREWCGRAVQRCDAHVIAVCRYVAEPWLRFGGLERVTVIYNGVAGSSRAATVRERPVVGCIGRIAPEKGQLEFVKAAARIHRGLPQCRFVLYGAAVIANPAYERAVRAAARGLPVEFAGWKGDVQAALADLDLLLVPSGPHEATTRVIPEAFAAGTPVIAFPSGGIPEVIDHGRTGYLAASADDMARQAIDLLRDRSRRAAIASAAHQTWATRFTLERWRTEVLDYISSRNIAAASRASMPAPARTGA